MIDLIELQSAKRITIQLREETETASMKIIVLYANDEEEVINELTVANNAPSHDFLTDIAHNWNSSLIQYYADYEVPIIWDLD